MFWVASIATVLAGVLTIAVLIGNKGSLHNYIDPSADWYLYGAWIVAAGLWILFGTLT
jgi:hypothetical protein